MSSEMPAGERRSMRWRTFWKSTLTSLFLAHGVDTPCARALAAYPEGAVVSRTLRCARSVTGLVEREQRDGSTGALDGGRDGADACQ
jgi:ABC-type sulfate transport system permease subunit